MHRVKYILFLILIVAAILAACSARPAPVQPTMAPTQMVQPAFTQSTENLPESDAEVRRITIEEARTALESGEAVMVDVRTPGRFEASHIAGAISVPLGAIERDLTDLPLDQDQWIITYCT